MDLIPPLAGNPACKLIRVLARFIATGRRSSGCDDLRRALRFVFRTILATGRTAAALDLRHPGRRTTTAPTATTSQPFQGHDRFFHLFPFHPQLGQHLVDVHFVPLPRKLTFLEHARSEKRTRTCQLVESVINFVPHSASLFKLLVRLTEQYGPAEDTSRTIQAGLA
jgi:hypothetical protein